MEKVLQKGVHVSHLDHGHLNVSQFTLRVVLSSCALVDNLFVCDPSVDGSLGIFDPVKLSYNHQEAFIGVLVARTQKAKLNVEKKFTTG